MAEALIQIETLAKSFDSVKAVDGLSFSVERGEVLGFLGPNGAGKSTTMKMITGFLPPSAGRIRVCGHDLADAPLKVQEKIGYLPEGAPAYDDMTVVQFLDFIADVRGLKGAAKAQALSRSIERTQLGQVLHQSIETLSKGFKRRVGLAQAILHDPEVLIMDEPTDGLDPNQKHTVRSLITAMAKEKAIIISTHILEEVEAICTRAIVIDRGRIVADSTPAALSARSKYFNAVSAVVAPDDAAAVRGALADLPQVCGVEETGRAGQIILTFFSKGGLPMIDAIGEAIARSPNGLNGKIHGLYVEAGRLEEVFRTLTTPDAVGPVPETPQASSGQSVAEEVA